MEQAGIMRIHTCVLLRHSLKKNKKNSIVLRVFDRLSVIEEGEREGENQPVRQIRRNRLQGEGAVICAG